MSVVVDDLGIYYDATQPSRLEKLVSAKINSEQELRIAKILDLWRQHGLSKYNSGQEFLGDLPKDYVLVVDQVWHDASVKFGLANEASFDAMLQAACDENPDSFVIVKIHPDIFTRKKVSHFDVQSLQKRPQIIIVAEACLPSRLIQNAKKVYTVTSQIGFEALIWQKPVRCFGMPFYAGWGLTDDALPAPARRGTATFSQLAFAALISYPKYVDSLDNALCEIERVIDYLTKLKHKV